MPVLMFAAVFVILWLIFKSLGWLLAGPKEAAHGVAGLVNMYSEHLQKKTRRIQEETVRLQRGLEQAKGLGEIGRKA